LLAQGLSSVEAERALCGLDHGQIGANLLQSWAFPTELVAAVRDHHSPGNARSTVADILYATELLLNHDEVVLNGSEYEGCCKRLGVDLKSFSLSPNYLDPELSILRFTAAA